MHNQPPKSPLSGGLWKLHEGWSYWGISLVQKKQALIGPNPRRSVISTESKENVKAFPLYKIW